MFELKIETNFSAAHHLLNYDGVCENQHGHNWKVEVYFKGEKLDKSNIFIDFKILKKEVNKIIEKLDHKDLNELPFFVGISPSSEIISKYIYFEVKKVFEQVYKVSVWETQNACASFFEE